MSRGQTVIVVYYLSVLSFVVLEAFRGDWTFVPLVVGMLVGIFVLRGMKWVLRQNRTLKSPRPRRRHSLSPAPLLTPRQLSDPFLSHDLSQSQNRPLPLARVDQPVIGYRIWTVTRFGYLRPLVMGWHWRPGVNRARCWDVGIPNFHCAPNVHCECGFYLYHEPRSWWPYENEGMLVDAMHAGQGEVAGAVVCWGKILRSRREGFRAQFAQVLALAPLDQLARHKIARVANRYGVPVIPARELESYAAEFGQRII